MELLSKFSELFSVSNRYFELVKRIDGDFDVLSSLHRMKGVGLIVERIDSTWEHIADPEWSWFTITDTGKFMLETYRYLNSENLIRD